MSIGLVIEEGLELAKLRRVLDSMAREAAKTSVDIITGDTKVVPRGRGGELYINTTGTGYVPEQLHWHPDRIAIDDVIIVTGDLGRHGLAIMDARE